MKRDIELLTNKSEITAGTRGASLGPEAIMTAARNKGSKFFGEFPIQHVKHMNHLLDEEVKFPHAKRVEGLIEVFSSVNAHVKALLDNRKFPLIIASDHGSAGGTIAGVKAAHPNKRLGVVWIDAHGDLHTPYTTPSGNMHGMPLAVALNEDNIPCKVNDISSDELAMWERLKSEGIEGPNIRPEDLVFISVRDTEDQEDAIIDRLNITNHTVESIREKGKEEILRLTLEQLSDCDIIYVSFDVDSMDPEHTSHGTGTPVDNGLRPDEAEYFLCELAKQDKLVCLEFVEVNPCLDEKTNKMAEVTFDLLESATAELER
ncbi:MAG: arginase [Crocinitomicaceae bacterium]|nr:arginase [Crocinitomicaceae bacterium]